MRRSAIISFTSVCLFGLIAACATSPADDPSLGSDLTSVKAPTEPGENVKLPPPSTAPQTPTDAGTNTGKDASAPAKDAGPPPAQDAGPPPNNNTTPDCDPNDPTLLLKIIISPPSEACPCASGQCCYQGLCI